MSLGLRVRGEHVGWMTKDEQGKGAACTIVSVISQFLRSLIYSHTEIVYAMAIILRTSHTLSSKDVAGISAVDAFRPELLLQCAQIHVSAIATEKPGYTIARNRMV